MSLEENRLKLREASFTSKGLGVSPGLMGLAHPMKWNVVFGGALFVLRQGTKKVKSSLGALNVKASQCLVLNNRSSMGKKELHPCLLLL